MESEAIVFRLKLVQDSDGFVTNIETETLAQDSLFGESLQHVGVKGMRWGVRRSRSAKYAEKAARKELQKRNKKIDIKSMSDDDLRKLVNRLELEKKFVSLTTKPSLVQKGGNMASKVLAEIGRETLKTIGKTQVNKRMGSLMTPKVVTPKP